MVPGDIYFFFECTSLANASPQFMSNVGIVMTQDSDVTQKNFFNKQMKAVEEKHGKFLSAYMIDFKAAWKVVNEFVLPFVTKLDEQPLINSWPYWNVKAQTSQFFIILNSLLYRLQEHVVANLAEDELDSDYPFYDMQEQILRNLILVATTWSFGAVLSRELRRMFDEQFSSFRSQFTIQIHPPMKQRFTLFEVFFDVQRLAWTIIAEKLDYK